MGRFNDRRYDATNGSEPRPEFRPNGVLTDWLNAWLDAKLEERQTALPEGYKLTTEEIYRSDNGKELAWAIVDKFDKIAIGVERDGTIFLPLNTVEGAGDFVRHTVGKVGDVWLSPDGEYYPILPKTDLVVFGDSLSTDALWPAVMRSHGYTVRANAVGGTATSDILARANVEKIQIPLPNDPISVGKITVKTQRHNTGRLTRSSYNFSTASSMSKNQGPPAKNIIFYNNGEKIAVSRSSKKISISTNYGVSQTRIYCLPGEELPIGTHLYFAAANSDLSADKQQELLPRPDSPSYTDSDNGLILWRDYTVLANGIGWFEVEFNEGDGVAVDLASDASGDVVALLGHQIEWDYEGGAWNLTIQTYADADTKTAVIWAGTNDFTNLSVSQLEQAKSNINALVSRQKTLHRRIILIPSLTGAYPDRTPTTRAVLDNNDFQAWLHQTYPEFVCDIKAALYADRDQAELDLMSNPKVNELIAVGGSPVNPVRGTNGVDAQLQWVGPDYLPLKHRSMASPTNWDLIHLNYHSLETMGLFIETLKQHIEERNWQPMGIKLTLDEDFEGEVPKAVEHPDLKNTSRVLIDLASNESWPAQTGLVDSLQNLVKGSAIDTLIVGGSITYDAVNRSIKAQAETDGHLKVWNAGSDPLGIENTGKSLAFTVWLRGQAATLWGYSIFNLDDGSHVNNGKDLGFKQYPNAGGLLYNEVRLRGTAFSATNNLAWNNTLLESGRLYQLSFYVGARNMITYLDGIEIARSAVSAFPQQWRANLSATLLNDLSAGYNNRIPEQVLHKFHLLTEITEGDFANLVLEDYQRVSASGLYGNITP